MKPVASRPRFQQWPREVDGRPIVTEDTHKGQTKMVNATAHSQLVAGLSSAIAWLWDSGANVSVTNNKSMLQNYRGSKRIKRVKDASGRAHLVKGYGDMLISVGYVSSYSNPSPPDQDSRGCVGTSSPSPLRSYSMPSRLPVRHQDLRVGCHLPRLRTRGI